MGNRILDGRGSGIEAAVSSDQRLLTSAVSLTLDQERAIKAAGYLVFTDILTLTTAGKSAVLHVKNNDTRDLQIGEFVFTFGVSVGGVGAIIGSASKNIDAGTILTATALTPVNTNFGSQVPASGDFRRGAEGLTGTGGVGLGDLIFGPASAITVNFDSVLPTGSSITLFTQPPPGNTLLQLAVLLKFSYLVSG